MLNRILKITLVSVVISVLVVDSASESFVNFNVYENDYSSLYVDENQRKEDKGKKYIV